jgi:two-component system nitrate/nitrite response regulator NarL
VRCLIVDDNQPFLNEARALLEREGIDIVGTATTGADALQKTAALQPEVILIDIDLGRESGFDVVRALAEAQSPAVPRVILISVHAESDFADLIAASPALGFASKATLSARAIHDVLKAAH